MRMNTSNKIALSALICFILLGGVLLCLQRSSSYIDNGIYIIEPECALIMGEVIVMNEKPSITDEQYREMLDEALVLRAQWYEAHPPAATADNNNSNIDLSDAPLTAALR